MNKKILLKTIITFVVIESIYLFAVPFALNIAVKTDCVKNIFASKTSATLNYENVKFKTHIKPALTVKIGKLSILSKEYEQVFISAQNATAKLMLFPLLQKKLNIQNIQADNLTINLEKDENGVFNFEKLFPSQKKTFKLSYKNSELNISDFSLSFTDTELQKSAQVKSAPISIKINSKKKFISALIKGQLITGDNKSSDFDINLTTKFPFEKNIDKNFINGNVIAYNIDLDLLKPFIQRYFDTNLTKFGGFIDFVQLCAEENNENNRIILNTTFNNLIYDRAGWENYVSAKGTNKINANVNLLKKFIDINTFSYTADKVNIKANGSINLKNKPELDLHTEIINSRAENIASILPPNLVKRYMTIQKVKKYGVFGDIEAKVDVKGKIPQPDIIGYVKGRNVHVLDKSIHNLHKGTVDIVFDKRILNMDIVVDLFDNQQAKIKGYTYMFRDGINNVTVKTTDNIDFPLAQKIIIPISKVFNFQLGPIPEMNITSGKGIIDLNIRGSMDLIDLKGYSEFDKAQLTYNGLFGEIKEGKGRLDFKGDVISFNSEKAFVKNNPLKIEGKVRINHNLDFSISSISAQADDILEIINKSELLKDVKAGLAVITEASGALRLFVNIKSKIVPVPYGQPPLPPEEAFEDMKVKGSVYMLGNSCKLDGFYTSIDKIKGIVDFTETVTNLQGLEGVSGTSPIKITGEIVNDLDTKIPDIDITVTSKSVNLKDTIKFLTQSYMYPKDYPDLSDLYRIASKHDLYFTYKAKSVDFLTDKAYAVMNFIPDNTNSALKATSGKIIMEKSTVYVEDVKAKLYDTNIKIDGNVKHIDTITPEYNLNINSDNFNLANLNDTSRLEILPDKLKKVLKHFERYYGNADIKLAIKKNLLDGKINIKNFEAKHIKSNLPFSFDNFVIHLNENKIHINNLTAQLGDIPLYGNITIADLYNNPDINGFFTSKITNTFIENYLPSGISNKFIVQGDINFSAKFNGTQDSFNLYPKLTFNPESDLIFDGTNLGEVSDKREFDGYIKFEKDKINIKKFDYIKYISSQNNKTFPVNFATVNGVLKIDEDNIILPEEMNIKTNKNLSARILNVFFKNQVLKQGTLNCDLKYITDKATKTGKLLGSIDCKNIDIPIFDTLVKNIQINGNKDKIDVKLFGFLADSRIMMNSVLENEISTKPKIKSLNIYADVIDNNKLLTHLSKTHNALTTNSNIKNMDLSGLSIENGILDIKEMKIKSLVAKNLKSNFSIDKNGIFHANNTQIEVGEGTITSNLSYNLATTDIKANFELANVDSNYVAETLFDAKNQIYGKMNGKIYLSTKGYEQEEIIKNLSGFVYFDIADGKMPKLGSLEYLLRASNIVKSGVTGFTLNSILELLNLVKTGYFTSISGGCKIENGIAKDIEIFSQGENLSLYIHGNYDISKTNAEMEILGKLSKRISTIFGTIGNTSLNTFFKLIPGISMIDFNRKNFIQDVEKIPPFTNGKYDSRTFQAIINGNINESGYVQSFKWVE